MLKMRLGHANRSSHRVQRSLMWLLALVPLELLFGLHYATGAPSALRPLVAASDWTVSGQFERFNVDAVSPIELPEDALQSPDLVLWHAWTPEARVSGGTVATRPFVPSQYMAVPHFGFPGERPENRIFLQCARTHREIAVATVRTNTQWATAFLRIPDDFCDGPVVLMATVASDMWRDIGVGTPFATSAATYHAQTGFPLRGLVVLTTLALIGSVVLCAGMVGLRLGAADALPSGFVGLGTLGILLFVSFHFSPTFGRTAVWLIVAAALAGAILTRIKARSLFNTAMAQLAGPMILWLAVALTATAFVSGADNGGGSWAINGLFTPQRWSSDNQLPFLFAEALFDGTPREQIRWGTWLASDRTPLLSALLLIPRTLVLEQLGAMHGSTFISTGYIMTAIALLSSWAAVMAWICTKFARATFATAALLVMTTPFVFFDTVYTWPKLLGASYALLAFGILYRMSRRRRGDGWSSLALVAACASLAYLSHASNAFALVAVAALFVPTILRQGGPAIALSALVAVVMVLPWTIWQAVVQPGGNALLRFALANDFGADDRSKPVLVSVVDAYGGLGVGGWISAKVEALRLLFGLNMSDRLQEVGEVAKYSPGLDRIGLQRVFDFYITRRSLGVAAVGLLVLALRPPSRRSAAALHMARYAALAGLGGILLMVGLTLPRAYMHHQAFGSLLLLVMAGSVTIATMSAGVSRTLLVVALTYFLVVWIIHPLAIAQRLHWPALFVAAQGGLLAVLRHGGLRATPVSHKIRHA